MSKREQGRGRQRLSEREREERGKGGRGRKKRRRREVEREGDRVCKREDIDLMCLHCLKLLFILKSQQFSLGLQRSVDNTCRWWKHVRLPV